MPGETPEWLLRARAVCFNATDSGLPGRFGLAAARRPTARHARGADGLLWGEAVREWAPLPGARSRRAASP